MFSFISSLKDKINAIWDIITNSNSNQEANDGYPLGVMVEGKQYYAETATLLLGAERRVEGLVWSTQKYGTFESHHEPFRIWMNPKFQHHPGIIKERERNYDAPIYN